MELKEQEMQKIIGGAITATFINAITKAVNTLYGLGRETGAAIRRLISGGYCPIN